jgi:hypothetical protein
LNHDPPSDSAVAEPVRHRAVDMSVLPGISDVSIQSPGNGDAATHLLSPLRSPMFRRTSLKFRRNLGVD